MSNARRIATITGTVAAGAALFLSTGAPAFADEGTNAETPAAPPKGSPVAGLDFFAGHLEQYHFGRTILGFDRAASDPYDWGVHHFVPTNLETVTRTLSPAQAPEVEGDTWTETPANEADPGHGHGPPSHGGQPLRAPINPLAGPEYLAKWAKNPNPTEAVPAAQETLRRSVTPTEDRPPNAVDKWSDKRPANGEESGPVLLPAEVAGVPAQASTTVGRYAAGVIDTAAGTAPNPQGPLLPVGGLLPH
ncbi:hypothetical protein [Saccharopolyspora gloriosae]|uniref:hypothetical protein n=1 Tax=Saccharopolyspora gloriosae TaxID=455344 RepID=UPI001FB80F44|nr:hypothetical protein [Saccharopolyspora gloriosae]